MCVLSTQSRARHKSVSLVPGSAQPGGEWTLIRGRSSVVTAGDTKGWALSAGGHVGGLCRGVSLGERGRGTETGGAKAQGRAEGEVSGHLGDG